MFPLLLDIAYPEPILESIGTSGTGVILGVALVLIVAAVVWIVIARKKKK